jgi:uncharacterized protein
MLLIMSAVALAAAQGVQESRPDQVSRIVVEGSGSAKNPPNVATISFDVQGEGQTSDQAVSALVAKSAAVENALRSMDPSLILHNASVRLQAVRGEDCKEDEDSDAVRLSKGACAIAGYVATQDFDVQTSIVADAGTMVGLAGRRGALNPKIDDYDLTDQRAARRQAIAAALMDAHAKAEAIAAASNSKVGEVLLVSLDGAASGQDIVVTGSRVRTVSSEEFAISVKVAPGPVVTRANVTVTYAIAR